MVNSVRISLLSLLLKKKSKILCTQKLSFLISLVLLLALSTVANADLLVGYPFEGSLSDVTGNYNGVAGGSPAPAFPADTPPGSSGSKSLSLTGDNYVNVPINAVNPFGGSSDFTIVAWFKSSEYAPCVLISSARDDTQANHSMAVFLSPEASYAMVYDNFYVGAVNTSTTGLNDGNWHHYAISYTASTQSFQAYLDGNPAGSNSFNPAIPTIVNDTVRIGNTLNTEFPAELGSTGWVGNIDDLGIYNSALTEPEIENVMDNGFGPISKVEILGDPNWTSGTTHAKEAGSDRALLFTAHIEDNDSPTVNLASVTYGGEAMTKVIDEIFVSSQNAYVVAYYLDEAGITAATSGSSFSLDWGSNQPDKAGYSSVFLSGVDQTYPLGYTDSAGVSGIDTVSTNPLPTSYGDMVILAGTCGSTGTYDVSVGSGFTEAIELNITQADGIAGYKSATGADETPTTVHTTTGRKVIIGFVVQTEGGTAPDTTPPTPTTSTWSMVPVAISAGAITMTATNATDDSGVEYCFDFNETGGGPGGDDSGWQESRTYTDSGLNPETQYTYRVITRDQAPIPNTGNWSVWASATTPEAPPPVESCPENDLTGDCKIDWKDLKCLTDQWLVPDCTSIPPGCACADLDGHTLVDFNDYALLAEDWGKGGIGVVINELMASNNAYPDPYGETDDWFEIYNPTDTPVDIAGMWVEDADRPAWQILTGYPETIIPGGGYLVLWADRDMHQGAARRFQTQRRRRHHQSLR